MSQDATGGSDPSTPPPATPDPSSPDPFSREGAAAWEPGPSEATSAVPPPVPPVVPAAPPAASAWPVYPAPDPTPYPSADVPYGSGYDTGATTPYAPTLFAAPAYGLGSPYGVAPQHPKAVTALVLGIVGLVVCPPFGIAGIVTGLQVRRDSDAQPGQFTGRSLGTAGLVLGIISILVMVFWVVVFAGVFAANY